MAMCNTATRVAQLRCRFRGQRTITTPGLSCDQRHKPEHWDQEVQPAFGAGVTQRKPDNKTQSSRGTTNAKNSLGTENKGKWRPFIWAERHKGKEKKKEAELTQCHVKKCAGSENGPRCRAGKAGLSHHFPGGSGLEPRRLRRDCLLHTIGDDRCTRAGSAASSFEQKAAVAEAVLRHCISSDSFWRWS